MSFDLTSILVVAGALVSGAVLALKVIAPRTKNTVDDQILVYAEDVEKVLEGIGGPKAASDQNLKVVPAV